MRKVEGRGHFIPLNDLTGVEGCGCGFAFYEREDRGVCIVYDKSHKALAKYVASCLKHVPFVELFSC